MYQSIICLDVESDSEEQTISKNGLTTPIKSKTEDELAADAILCSSNSEDTEPGKYETIIILDLSKINQK